MEPERWQRIRELFGEAVELVPAARASFLDRAADDPELRLEVEALLAHDEEGSDPVREAVGRAMARAVDETRSPRLRVGQRLARYRILSRLGEGGMGEVYKARDLELLRDVALKVLASWVTHDLEHLSRFRREAQALAAFNHPSIVTIHSVEEARGIHFLTMELIEGEDLADLIPAGGLALERFFELAIPVADALSAAHERGIVHRDLKPTNVRVTADGRVKVLDFGLAKLSPPAGGEQSATEALLKTREGAVLGTVPYMSPEQLQGRGVDGRSDLFSLGVLLYEMVTGQRPFRGQTAFEVKSAIVNDTPPPVSELRPVPRQLAHLIAGCLEKDPERRPWTAKDLRDQLDGLRAEPWTEQILGGRRPTAGRTRARGARRWIAAAAALVILTAALAYLVSRSAGRAAPVPTGEAGAAAVTARERLRIVVLPFENLGAPEEEYFASGLADEITSRLAAVNGLAVISRRSAGQYAGTDKSIRQIGEELQVGYVLEGTVRWAPGAGGESRVAITPKLVRVADETHVWAKTYERVLDDIFAVQADLAREVLQQLDVALPAPERRALEARPTESLEAYKAYLRSMDYLRRPEYYLPENQRRTVEWAARAIELDPAFALAYVILGGGHAGLAVSGIDRSPQRLKMAREAIDTALALEPDLPHAHLALAVLYRGMLDYEKALAELAVAERGLPNDSSLLEIKGRIRRAQGSWIEGSEYMRRALDLNPRDARLATALGYCYTVLRSFDEAERLYNHSIALEPEQMTAYVVKAVNSWSRSGDTENARTTLEAMPVQDHPIVLLAWWLQEIYEGDPEAALHHLSAAPFELVEDPHRFIPKAQLEGQTHLLLGRPERARRAYESARALLEKELEARPGNARARGSLGRVYAALGRAEEAVRQGRLGVELEPFAKDAELAPWRVEDLARILTAVGEHDEAVDQIELLLSIPSLLSVPLLEIDPDWDPLRENPRFRKLLASSTNSP